VVVVVVLFLKSGDADEGNARDRDAYAYGTESTKRVGHRSNDRFVEQFSL